MTDFTISLAGVNIGISAHYASSKNFCKGYLTSGNPEIKIRVEKADIDFEREKNSEKEKREEHCTPEYSDQYLETLAIYRKIAEQLLEKDILLFHGSAIAVDEVGYLFTAPSGTGKSTHTRLWCSLYENRACVINDDKPLLIIKENTCWVCGTPWDGKHRLSTNMIVPLKGICILEQGEKNQIVPISVKTALPMLIQQCYRSSDADKLKKMLELVNRITKYMPLYQMKCNMEMEAAEVAYNALHGKEIK